MPLQFVLIVGVPYAGTVPSSDLVVIISTVSLVWHGMTVLLCCPSYFRSHWNLCVSIQDVARGMQSVRGEL